MEKRQPLTFVFYIEGRAETVWNAFVSEDSNRTLFMGAEFQVNLSPGGSISWSGKGPDGKPVKYVQGTVLKADAPRLLSYTYAMGSSKTESRVTIELLQEREATKVKVTHDDWAEDDETYAACADGWPRILSRLKTLIETGKTFQPH
jgi:uncharacterized protein YndB with AHSA1/START domain